jgi:hypothetical protein
METALHCVKVEIMRNRSGVNIYATVSQIPSIRFSLGSLGVFHFRVKETYCVN